MGIFGHEVRREFIARPDSSKNEIVYKWPDHNIRRWSQLTVQQDEVALFFRDGRVVGIVQPGRAQLDSSEIPFLGILLDTATGGNFFLTEIYFISVREFPGLRFGGVVDNVVDPETQLAVGLRVFGEYSVKVTDPSSLIVNLVGTQQLQSNDQITDWLREQLLKVFRDAVTSHIVQNNWPILGIAARTAEIEQDTLAQVQSQVQSYGMQIVRMGNFTISIKDDDEATLKNYRRDVQYTRLAGGFQQYGAGEALRGIGEGAAKGEGGLNNPAVLGVGMGLGGMVQGMGAGQNTQAAQVQVRCPKCGTLNPDTAKFCNSCGQNLLPEQAPAPAAATPAVAICPKCGSQNPGGARFCANCGTSLAGPDTPSAPSAPQQ